MDMKYLRRVGIYVLSAIISLALTAYIGYHIFRRLSSEVETVNASAVSVSLMSDAPGYVMKEEILLTAQNQGSFTSLTADGTKVGVGDAVAALYSRDSSLTVQKISTVNEQLALLEKAAGGVTSLKNTGVTDAEIFELLLSVRSQGALGNYGNSNELFSRLVLLLTQREIITGSISPESAIKMLEAERDSLYASLGECRETVYTGRSGYFYSKPDGYEAAFSSVGIMDKTYSEFRDMIETTESVPIPENCPGKLSLSYLWYLTVPIERGRLEGYGVGDVLGVIFRDNGDRRLEMKIERIVTDAGEDTVYLVLSSGTVISGFGFERVQRIKLVTDERDGFMIPAGALRVHDGKEGVFILDKTTVRFREVKVIRREGEYYIADVLTESESEHGWLEENDKIIVAGKGLYDGRFLN